MELTRQLVNVETGSPDEAGCLLFIDGRLVAVFVQLGLEHNSGLAGKWFLEHAFGSMDKNDQPIFDDLEAAESWVTARLSA